MDMSSTPAGATLRLRCSHDDLQVDKLLSARDGVIHARRVTMNMSEMNRLLIELVDLDVWAEHAAILLDRADLGGLPPWPYFVDECKVWA